MDALSTTNALPSALAMGLFGLLLGSFLNVLILRFPKMLEARWKKECAQLQEQGQGNDSIDTDSPSFNLFSPGSHCPACQHALAWYHNIPVLSYLALRGRCAFCAARIAPRYPIIELAAAALFFACGWRWGWTAEGWTWSGFCATLLALGMIDWDTTLLPDDLTLPLLWAGLIASAIGITPVALTDAVWGAVAGYLALWCVFWGFRFLTGKEGMGYGDFKLYAALGAWFGWQALIAIILLASIIGAIVGIALQAIGGLRDGRYVPFGPFLAAAGLATLWWGPAALLGLIGL